MLADIDDIRPSDDKAEELFCAYSFGVMPLSGWATEDLVALANAIDDEIEIRGEDEEDNDEQ